MENILQINLPSKVKFLLEKLMNNGYDAFVVGGAVRDSILGLPVADYDITTNALPNQIEDVFAEYEVIETGIKHGTVTVVVDKEMFEITTFRIDGEYTDNRHPASVEFTSKLIDDLSRRDFTVNALAADIDGNVIDYFNGIADIKGRLIRCVGDADQRFNEDALRILRALRFAAKLDFFIFPSTASAIHNNKQLLRNIAKERIQKEFNLLLTARYPKQVSNIMTEFFDVFKEVIPYVENLNINQNNKYHRHNSLLAHTLAVVENVEINLILKLAAFFHDIGKADCYSEEILADGSIQGHFYGHPDVSAILTERILRELKYSNDIIEHVVWLVKFHDYTIAATKRSVRKFLMKCPSLEYFENLLQLKRSDRADHINLEGKYREHPEKLMEIRDQILEEQAIFSLKDLAISGYDMINLGLKGPEIGKALNSALEAVIEEQVPNDKEELINFVKSLI